MNAARRRRRNASAATKPPPSAGFAVKFYELSDFPELRPGEQLAVPELRADPMFPGVDRSPQTIFRATDLWTRSAFQRLDVVHEQWKRGYQRPAITKTWRVDDQIRNGVIERFEFSAYLTPDRRGIYMRAKGALSDSALRALRRDRSIGSKAREINIKAFLESFKSPVQRAWFNQLRIMNVQSAAIAGKDVDKSADYRRYLGAGNISAVEVQVEFQGAPRWVIISQTNTIFFYLQDERMAISLAAYVNDLITKLAEAKVAEVREVSTDDEDALSPNMGSGFGVSQAAADEQEDDDEVEEDAEDDDEDEAQ